MRNLYTINNKLLFNQIYNKLKKEFGRLPDSGVVAGQAVSSAVIEMLGIGKGIYNDLDIFCTYSEYPNFHPEEDEMYRSRSISTVNKTDLTRNSRSSGAASVWVGSYDVDVGHIKQTGYSITSSSTDPRNPNHNYVEVSDFFGREEEPGEVIINSFDINCVQISIDLKNKTVHWSKDFQNFLYSKELKVTYYGTPMHTSIRLLKKEKDLPFTTLDLNSEMKKLQTIRAFMHAVENEDPERPRHIPGNLFSSIYKNRYDENSKVLNNFFDIVPKNVYFKDTHANRQFHVLKPKDYCKETLETLLKIYIDTDREAIDKAVPYFESLYDVFNTKAKKNQYIKNAISLLNERSYGYRTSVMFLSNALTGKHMDFSGFSDPTIRRYLKFSQQHSNFMAQLSHADKDINEQMKIVKQGMWLQKNHMRYMVGQAENNSEYGFIKTMEKWNGKGFRAAAKIENAQYMKELSGKIIKPLFDDILNKLSKKFPDVKITEMTSGLRLFWEGEDLRHCVGGYWESVEKGKSLIFALESKCSDSDKPYRSTIDLSHSSRIKNNERCYNASVSQHYSYNNKRVEGKHVDVEIEILNELNLLFKCAQKDIEINKETPLTRLLNGERREWHPDAVIEIMDNSSDLECA
jgi:hypothetical protein